ncbi:extracellular solute-binding protein [Cohnella endophytica]|uniref:Extracellular solute-binding protein n=1 Tax=Cohnella endophytica TaxID=2419778 RepID=A0A494Y6Q9_9BACL|nr:extracellular solute-binding protein [Cohnella endophytica]RKP56273.1 extracellular solute-binding protein [Cohnella endophytica]
MALKKKVIRTASLSIAMASIMSLLAACGGNNNASSSPSSSDLSANASPSVAPSASATASPSASASSAEPVTLTYWTWDPPSSVLQPILDKFQADYPNITVKLSVWDQQNSSGYQQKMPLGLSTGEDIDVVGVQGGGMGKQIEQYLLPLDDLLAASVGDDWQNKLTPNSVKQLKTQVDGDATLFISQGSVGSMVMYYNKDILDQLGVAVPKTYDDLKVVVQAIKDKKMNIIPVAVNGKDGWTLDEVAWTIAGQQSDLYNRWRYNQGGKFDSPEYIQALTGFKKLFDDGIFSKKDVMDLDYNRSKSLFTSGKAAFFIQGTWEAAMISDAYRKENKININDIGIIPIPSIEAGGKASIRAFIDNGLGIVKTSKHPREAMELIKYLTFGAGDDAINSQFRFVSNKSDAAVDPSILTTPTAQESYQTLVDLISNAPTDRNNNSPFSNVAGDNLIKMILNKVSPENTAKAIQAEFDKGKMPN